MRDRQTNRQNKMKRTRDIGIFLLLNSMAVIMREKGGDRERKNTRYLHLVIYRRKYQVYCKAITKAASKHFFFALHLSLFTLQLLQFLQNNFVDSCLSAREKPNICLA